MTDKTPNKKHRSGAAGARTEPPDRYPTNEELLRDLSPYGPKPLKPRELPRVNRRTRDFLIVAGVGSAGIVLVAAKLVPSAEVVAVVRLSLTAVVVFCGLLWYIFYGVMNRY